MAYRELERMRLCEFSHRIRNILESCLGEVTDGVPYEVPYAAMDTYYFGVDGKNFMIVKQYSYLFLGHFPGNRVSARWVCSIRLEDNLPAIIRQFAWAIQTMEYPK